MPKLTGSHPEKRLSAVKINSLREPGRYADRNGSYLEVTNPTVKVVEQLAVAPKVNPGQLLD